MGFQFTRPGSGGYGRGPGLVDLTQHVKHATDRAMHEIAHEGGQAMTRHVAEHTPKRTGATAASWMTKPVTIGEHAGTLTFESGTESHSHIARWLEHGVDPHDLPKRPGGVVSFIDPRTGQRVTVRRFRHPGIRGLHLVANAAAFVEADMVKIAEPVLRHWKRDAEQGFR